MTILTFKIECESSPKSINIMDWRFMSSCMFYYGNTESAHGTRLILPSDMIDILGYTPSMTRKMIFEDDIYENVIFSRNYNLHPGLCSDCGGLGKHDWISSAMSRRAPGTQHGRDSHARLFKRNKERVLFYISDRYYGGYDFNRAFAPTRAEQSKAEFICESCFGTGLRLDGRHRLFADMRGIRNKLEEFEWDGLNLPDIAQTSN